MSEDKLSAQLQAIIDRIKTAVPGLASVIGLEELDDALGTDNRLPAAVVVYSGDYPAGIDTGKQIVKRYWSVILVLELQRDPKEAIDLAGEIKDAGKGFWPCTGVGMLTPAGIRFVTKFDNTRVAYEVRFVGDAWEIYNDEEMSV